MTMAEKTLMRTHHKIREAYRPTEQNIEVLERNGRHMRAKNTRKRLVVRTRATAPLNPVEIGVEVETVLHVSDDAGCG